FARTQALGEKAAEGILISWRGLARIFLVQQLHAFIGQITSAFTQAISQSIEFQKQISAIRTISQENQLSFARWSEEVRKLSVEFGQTPVDVAKGAYELISAQVTHGAETFDVLRVALELSRATFSTTNDSVQVLQATMNSFGLRTFEAERVAAVLFKTVDLGNVTLPEMAQNFGRVANISSEAGITLEEMAAAIQTLTNKGITFERSSTFLINIISSLLKPSKEGSELFQSWGVSSFEAAVQTFSFAGVLGKLNDEMKTLGVERLSKIIPDLRGLQGALGLTGSSFEQFTKDIELTKNGASQFKNAVAISFESAGQKI